MPWGSTPTAIFFLIVPAARSMTRTSLVSLLDTKAVAPSGVRSTANGAGGVATCLATFRDATSTIARPAEVDAGAGAVPGFAADFGGPASATTSRRPSFDSLRPRG